MYNPPSNQCNLCLQDKYLIICRAHVAMLNKQKMHCRQVIVSIETASHHYSSYSNNCISKFQLEAVSFCYLKSAAQVVQCETM